MTGGTLRVRLIGLAAVAIALALISTWAALTLIFRHHLEKRVDNELANEIVWIAANLRATPQGISLQSEPPDPRFERPLGGRYWQIEPADGDVIRSRSLWDETLPHTPLARSAPATYSALGSQGNRLLIRAEQLRLSTPEGEKSAKVMVAADYREVNAAVTGFGRDLASGLLIVGMLLTAGAALQVRVGLAPLRLLRSELASIRSGGRSRLTTGVPSEVRPLVDEVNELLDSQEEALARARAQAADLAHGLKTPLTILATVASSLARRGEEEDAAEIVAQVQMMERRIDRQLARARLGAGHSAASNLTALVEQLVKLTRRTPKGERLEWHLNLEPDAIASVDEVDLAEAVGNVLDNASKWASTKVNVASEVKGAWISLCIDDDGPGVPEDRLGKLFARGARLDSRVEGSGLGLAIVRDIAAAYGARVRLSPSQLGGLGVRIDWPRQSGKT